MSINTKIEGICMLVDIHLQFFKIEDIQYARMYMRKFDNNFVSTVYFDGLFRTKEFDQKQKDAGVKTTTH
jgi:hypothetical protein